MATPTRLDRYVSRVEQDQRTHDLLILIHTHRGQGFEWGDIVGVLADVIDMRVLSGASDIRDRLNWSVELTAAFRDYAGPYRLWETVLHAIAVAWGQERERNTEAEEGIQQ